MYVNTPINTLPPDYRIGLVEKGFENGEEIDPEYWLVLWHQERPLLRRALMWVRVDAQRIGYQRNRSIEAAIRGVWLVRLSQKKKFSLRRLFVG